MGKLLAIIQSVDTSKASRRLMLVFAHILGQVDQVVAARGANSVVCDNDLRKVVSGFPCLEE
jgi:hypothetical protein